MRIESASEADRERVLALLKDADLPLAGVEANLGSFLLALENDALAGCIGLEIYEDIGLLRSLAVHPEHRGTGVGKRLVDALLDRARGRGLRGIYLLTTTAERYFPKFGFEALARDAADSRLEASEEFRGACPDSAVLMRLSL